MEAGWQPDADTPFLLTLPILPMYEENAIMLGFVRQLADYWEEEEKRLQEDKERRWTQEDEYFNKF
jgi:hypothetical protein